MAQVSQVDNDFSAGGGIRIGAAAGTCDGTIDGALRYNTGNLEVCNGSAWLTTLTSSLNPVVNNGNSFSAAMVIGTNDSNTLSFETNGTTRMTINTSGDVGIGTTSPGSALDLNGAATVRAIAAPAVSSAGQGRIYFDSTSNTFKVSENGGAYSNLVSAGSGDFLADGSVPMTGAFQAVAGSQGSPGITFNGDEDTGFFTDNAGVTKYSANGSALYSLNTTDIRSTNVSGFLLRQSGSAVSTPSYSWAADTDSGFYRDSANKIGLATGGAARLVIDNVGNVGIGTNIPAATFDVTGTDAIIVPNGTTAQRPGTPQNGMIRYNSTNNQMEAYENGGWANMIGGGAASSVAAIDGSNGSPSISFASDSDSGLYRMGADHLALTTGNDGGAPIEFRDGYRIDLNGNWQIQEATYIESLGGILSAGGFIADGMNSATQVEYYHSGDSNTGLFFPAADNIAVSTGGTERIRIDSTGNVGIGTTSPSAPLHVINNMNIDRAGASPNISMRRAQGTLASKTAVVNGVELFQLNGTGYDGSSWYEGGRIAMTAEENFSGTNGGTNIRFYTTPTGTVTETETMRLSANGYLGIGTTAPNVALDVTGDIEYTGVITDVSDRRRKEDIQPLQNGLATIEKIDGVSFVMKGDESKRVEFGVIAQDVEKVLPELVHIAKDEDQTRSVNYIGFIGWMIEAIKDLARGDRQLQKQLNAKDQKISELEDRIQKLEEFILKSK